MNDAHNERAQAYRRLFLDQEGRITRDAEVVLSDLRRFCRASTTTVVVSPVSRTIDPLGMALAEGRREVWNRMQAYLNYDDSIINTLRNNYDPNHSQLETE